MVTHKQQVNKSCIGYMVLKGFSYSPSEKYFNNMYVN